jgi:hypothetical protein
MKTQKSTDNEKQQRRRREYTPLSMPDALWLLELMVTGEVIPAGHVCKWSNNAEGQCVLTIETASYYDYEGKRGIAMYDPYWRRVEQRKAQAAAAGQAEVTGQALSDSQVNQIEAMTNAVIAQPRRTASA